MLNNEKSINNGEYTYLEYYDPDYKLDNASIAFILEQFSIVDIDALSDEAFSELYYKLCDIETDEVAKAAEISMGTPISEYGIRVAGIVAYMSGQFIEGESRWKSNDSETIVQEQQQTPKRPSRFNND